jgi:hypothetical protein
LPATNVVASLLIEDTVLEVFALLQQKLMIILDVPSHTNGELKVNVLIPTTGAKLGLEYTLLFTASMFVVNAVNAVCSILIAKPVKVEPAEVNSIARELIFPG